MEGEAEAYALIKIASLRVGLDVDVEGLIRRAKMVRPVAKSVEDGGLLVVFPAPRRGPRFEESGPHGFAPEPGEAVYRAFVSSRVLECDCPRAREVVERARRQLHLLGLPSGWESTHVLCPHTVRGIGIAIEEGVVGATDEFMETLELAVIALALSEGRISEEAIEKMGEILGWRARARG